MNSLAVFCACLLMMGCVRSTPVYPNAPLGHLSTVDVCLFMCNICFDDMDSAMMDCVNKVCLNKTQFEINLYLIKLGRTCKNYSKIDSTMFGNESD